MKFLSLVVLFLFSPFIHAQDKNAWSNGDTAREVAFQVLHVIDWGQTLYLTEHPDVYRETNPILGDMPTRGQVNTYFIATGLLHYGVSRWLNRPARNWFQYITISYQVINTANNYHVGVKVSF